MPEITRIEGCCTPDCNGKITEVSEPFCPYHHSRWIDPEKFCVICDREKGPILNADGLIIYYCPDCEETAEGDVVI